MVCNDCGLWLIFKSSTWLWPAIRGLLKQASSNRQLFEVQRVQTPNLEHLEMERRLRMAAILSEFFLLPNNEPFHREGSRLYRLFVRLIFMLY